MKHTTILLLVLLSILLLSCNEEFLDKKSDKSIIIPTTYSDLQSLLDNNVDAFNIDPCLGFIGSDDYYIEDMNWPYLYTAAERNGYTWNKEVYEGQTVADWNTPYKQVFYSNVILEQLDKLKPSASEITTWNTLKGSALFYRSYAFYNLLQLFAAPYNNSDIEGRLGIPLRVSADVNAPIFRATLKESYDQVLKDVKLAIPLLPVQSIYKTRPSKGAAYGFLARTYLVMRDYENSKLYADSCLALNSSLMNYNELNASASRPIKQFNDEVIFHSTQITYGIRTDAYINADLYLSYDDNDLRKTIFVDNSWGVPIFKGWYSGSSRLFSGIATDEIFLTRAECYARLGDKEKALADLNTVLEKRWATGTFAPFTATTIEEALQLILTERRKELVFRNTRWSDLRRLNTEPNQEITLIRSLDGGTYTLPPNDVRYVYPIPPDEILLSRIIQNPR